MWKNTDNSKKALIKIKYNYANVVLLYWANTGVSILNILTF